MHFTSHHSYKIDLHHKSLFIAVDNSRGWAVGLGEAFPMFGEDCIEDVGKSLSYMGNEIPSM